MYEEIILCSMCKYMCVHNSNSPIKGKGVGGRGTAGGLGWNMLLFREIPAAYAVVERKEESHHEATFGSRASGPEWSTN